jgi:type IV pilus assembly protein PilC
MTFQPGRRHHFYAELAKLAEAGFGIREAADVMRRSQVPAAERSILDAVDAGLGERKSIAGAFASSGALGELELSIIDAGERGGKLAAAFNHLAGYFALLDSSRRAALRALAYPAVLLHLGIFVGVFPSGLMRGDGAGALIREFVLTLIVTYLVLLGLFLAGRTALRAAADKASPDRLINRIPLLGAARRNLALARFAKVFHTCLLAGISMTETAATAAKAARSGGLREAGGRVAEAAGRGEQLGPHFMAEGDFPPAFARSYATAEEAGSLDKELARWSKLFEQEADGAMRALATGAPKVMYFAIIVFVAWKIVSFYSGYYGVLDSIGE